MPGRQYHSGGPYRYGFNGKENDIETTSSSGGTQDYGMRIYNPALGRFLSVDPIAKEYPMLTPYQFASNTPIWATDLDGLEANYVNIISISKNGKAYAGGVFTDPVTNKTYNEGRTVLVGPNANDLYNEVSEINININKYGLAEYEIRNYRQFRPYSIITNGGNYFGYDRRENNMLDTKYAADAFARDYSSYLSSETTKLKKGETLIVTGAVISIDGITDPKELQKVKKEMRSSTAKTLGISPNKITFTKNQSSSTTSADTTTTTDGTKVVTKETKAKMVNIEVKTAAVKFEDTQ